ncbi:L-aspartate oxidase [Lysobacter panacisoli]|uniref:L-aspartate oxidase n=1 Tax=Lysobacter panacisoli TaxID=1255263 RepID=A0ABP9L6U1_9GAMM|nr:L-aspartate oxidase [Lysobacter panacisoli]
MVVGAGIAGLSTALSAAPREVVLLDAGGLNASRLAQGGIAAALGHEDNVRAHVADTLTAGAHHNDATIVWNVLVQAREAIAWLESNGLAFDRTARGEHALGREGGHGRSRIVHAGGDRTGERAVVALRERVHDAAHVQWRENTEVEALLMADGMVVGVRVRNGHGHVEEIDADAVVLATGGIGALYARTTNPGSSRGSGIALGLAAGARTRDLEFVQFHPTAFDGTQTRLPLITEALRGAGARLLDHRGDALMQGRHPLGDLAPRDIVARRVWEAGRDGPVWLDATSLPDGWTHAFPTVLASCREHGVDPRHDRIPIAAAAHFHMGGLATDPLGRTSVTNLYAVGEVACNGLHGANRLASNSLLEGVVCGRRTGRHLRLRHAASTAGATITAEPGSALAPPALARLREILWNAAGPVRNAEALRDACAHIDEMAGSGWETTVAQRLLASALRRSRSLGAHWREDG